MLPCKKNRLVLQYLNLKNQKLNRTGIFICAIFLYICVVPKTQAKALLSF